MEPDLKTRGEVEAYCAGLAQAIWLYAWWKDGVQYVGCGIYTMESALKEVERTKMNRLKALEALPKQEGP